MISQILSYSYLSDLFSNAVDWVNIPSLRSISLIRCKYHLHHDADDDDDNDDDDDVDGDFPFAGLRRLHRT